jgi:hypothetical protein
MFGISENLGVSSTSPPPSNPNSRDSCDARKNVELIMLRVSCSIKIKAANFGIAFDFYFIVVGLPISLYASKADFLYHNAESNSGKSFYLSTSYLNVAPFQHCSCSYNCTNENQVSRGCIYYCFYLL